MEYLKTYSKAGVTLITRRYPVISEEEFVSKFTDKLDEYRPFDRIFGVLDLYKWLKSKDCPIKVEYDWNNPWSFVGWLIIHLLG